MECGVSDSLLDLKGSNNAVFLKGEYYVAYQLFCNHSDSMTSQKITSLTFLWKWLLHVIMCMCGA